MNWYKTAFPVFDKPRGMHYIEIGHSGHDDTDVEEERLWVIFVGFEFIDMDVTGKNTGHHIWFFKEGWDDQDKLASGRYSKKKGQDQADVSVWFRGTHSSLRDRIIEILDRQYNNPRIIEFN